MKYVIAIDQSTSATKAMLFSYDCQMLHRVNIAHKQYYPKPGFVEHDAMEIYQNTVNAIRELLVDEDLEHNEYSLCLTNQRETAVVWDKRTGTPIANAVVWQCMRGKEICEDLKERGFEGYVKQRTGLLIDPYFSASGVKWLLNNVPGARQKAQEGRLLMGTIDTWLVWKLTNGASFVTDYTNASRTMLFNIHNLSWDEDLCRLLGIPMSMLPKPMPSDSCFGETTVEGLFPQGIKICGILGDSHGALAGQMCFHSGLGKATYGTGSSVMVNIGEEAKEAPEGLVTSVAFAALGKVFYAFEGNIHSTGATLKWLQEQLHLIDDVAKVEREATSVASSNGVYFVPAFAGLGAPWWSDTARAAIMGMTLSTTKAHVLRAALESIAFQVTDLVSTMTQKAGVSLKEIRVDGGPTKNRFLMQFQADCLGVDVNCSTVEEASALGAVIMNGLALGVWKTFDEVSLLRKSRFCLQPQGKKEDIETLLDGWHKAVKMLIN